METKYVYHLESEGRAEPPIPQQLIFDDPVEASSFAMYHGLYPFVIRKVQKGHFAPGDAADGN